MRLDASIRVALSLSQRELAQKLGVTESTIRRWETNQSTPQPRHQRAIDKLLADNHISEEE